MSHTQVYRKIQTRPLDLIGCECWDFGERLMMPRVFENLLFFDPLFIYRPGKAVAVYYNFTDPAQDLRPLWEYLETHLTSFKIIKTVFELRCSLIRRMQQSQLADYVKFNELIISIWPVITVANVFGSTEVYAVSKELMELCLEIRRGSDDVLHSAVARLSEIINTNISTNSEEEKSLSQFVTYTEYVNGELPIRQELETRKEGYVYHLQQVFTDINEYLNKSNFTLDKNVEAASNDLSFSGQTACRGVVRGVAKIVFELSDLSKINEGDILVAPMTIPEMLSGMKLAAGFVTDEGGITCHAAIVARELKKPCIIGTKVATSRIQDGDLIEVDADRGVVNLIR